MTKLRVLSGKEVVKILEHFDFRIVDTKGSHVKLRRMTDSAERQTLTIPNHRELDKGTLRAIFAQSIKYIPGADLRPFFYS